MPFSRSTLESVHIVALGLWVGTLGMAGAAAAIVFPMMRDLDPTLAIYAAYPEPHWRLAAGHVAASLFFISDLVQLVCAGLAGLALTLMVLLKRAAWPDRALAGRFVIMTLLLALLSYRFFILAPRMDQSLAKYRSAAQIGDVASAATHAAEFNDDHPIASNTMSATFVLALGGLILGAWHAASGWPRIQPSTRPR